jgi:phospholipid/cholesterol/gamma-HCH transport system permease protein
LRIIEILRNPSATDIAAVEMIEQLGASILDGIVALGNFVLFLFYSIVFAVVPPYKARLAIRQIRIIGADSLLLILLIGAFTGMVLGLQGDRKSTRLNSSHP